MAKKKISEKNAYFAQQRKEQRRKENQEIQKKARKKKIIKRVAITATSCILGVAIIGGSITYCVTQHPIFHWTTVEKTEHYSLSSAEVSFFAWELYQQYTADTTIDDDSKPDTSEPLSDQSYTDSDGNTITWEQYFKDSAVSYGENVLVLCEAAYQNGYTPEDDIDTTIDETISTYMESEDLPKGITEKDVRSALEKYYTAYDYSNYTEDNLTFTDDELEDYYQENAQSMEICSYMSFSFYYSIDEDSVSPLTEEEAQDYARELERCSTEEEFTDYIRDYYKDTTDLTGNDLDVRIESLGLKTTYGHYTEGDSVSEWVFSGEAKAGQSKIIQDEENGLFTICLLLTDPERDETNPVDIRQILFTTNTYGSEEDAHNEAQECLDAFNNLDAEQITSENFGIYADNYSEDTSVTGGLYTDVAIYEAPSDWVDWLYDENRQPGDTTVLDASYGCSAIYFVQRNEEPNWKVVAKDALKTEKYETAYADYTKQADVQKKSSKFVKVNTTVTSD